MSGAERLSGEREVAPLQPAASVSDSTSAAALPAAAMPNTAMARLAGQVALRRDANGSQGAGPLDPEIGANISRSLGGGHPIPNQARSELEGYFGTDLSPVRIHDDAEADELSRSVQAKAFTAGSDVFFAAGQFQPGTTDGQRLLAHEVTHTLQRSTGAEGTVVDPGDATEVEADQVAEDFVNQRTLADPPTAPAEPPPDEPPSSSDTGSSSPSTVRRTLETRGVLGAVHRQPAAPGTTDDTDDPPQPLRVYEPFDDIFLQIAHTADDFYAISKLSWDDAGQQAGHSEDLFQPAVAVIRTENKLIYLDAAGNPHTMQDTTSRISTSLSGNRGFLMKLRTRQAWILMQRGGVISRAQPARSPGEVDEAMTPSDAIVWFVYPGLTLNPAQIRRVEQMIRNTEAAIRRSAGPPRWSRNRLTRVIDRRTGRTSDTDNETTDEADHDTADTTGGTGEHGTGGGGESAEVERVQDPSRPLQGPIKLSLTMSRRGYPRVRIKVDGVTTSVSMRHRDSDEELNARIDEAIDQLQREWDPDTPRAIEDAATATGIQDGPADEVGERVDPAEAQAEAGRTPGRALEGERVPGAAGVANAPQYPSSITMSGYKAPQPQEVSAIAARQGDPALRNREHEISQDHDPSAGVESPPPPPSLAPAPQPTIAQDVQAPTTTEGATNRFTMNLDYGARSINVRDEVFNRLQPINFYWELLEVPGLTAEQAQARARRTAIGGANTRRTRMGQSMDIERGFDDIAEDQQADLRMMEEEDWSWPAKAAYLGVIGLSNSVRAVGTLISSYVSLITQPRSERSIGFDREGIFLVRCIATPRSTEEALADPDNHVIRMSSIAVMPIRVLDLNRRATEGLEQEDRELAQLQQAVANARTPEERRLAELQLRTYRGSQRRGASQIFSSSVDKVRDLLLVAEALQRHKRNNTPDDEWAIEEIELEIALLSRDAELDAYIRQLRTRLELVAGRGATSTRTGRHERWVGEQLAEMNSEYRPRVVLASQENGQVSPILAMLGEHEDSTPTRQKWVLVDIGSASSRKSYAGDSALPGDLGKGQAIRAAFRKFAGTNGYGRGTIAIRLPEELARNSTIRDAVPSRMRSTPDDWSRATQRLQDLAAAAAIAGLLVTGPVGIAVGVVGGVAGAVVAVDSLIERSETGHVWEVGTIFDIVGVVGGLAAVGGAGTAIARMNVDDIAAATRPSWVQRLERTERGLQIHGHVDNALQLIQIPYATVEELEQIQKQLAAGGLSEGEARSRGALAVLRALKDGTMTIVGMTHEGGFDPLAARNPDRGGAEGSGPRYPDGHHADHADRVAEGTADPLGPALPEGTRPHGEARPDPARLPDEGPAPETTTRLPPDADLVAEAQRRAELTRRRADQAADREGRAQRPEPGNTGPAPTDRHASSGGDNRPTLTPSERAARAASVIDSLSALAARVGTDPPEADHRPRPGTTVADPDAVRAVRDAGDFGALRRQVDAMQSLTGPQRLALQARLHEARTVATNEQVARVLQELQNRFPELTFSVQDFGTPGFNSDLDITIRATPRDPGVYGRATPVEQQAINRRMTQASAEAVPLIYAALDAVGLPPNRALDTNFYTELHEGRLQPVDATERVQIVADQEVVALTEMTLSLDQAAWDAYVTRQRARIGALEGLSDADRSAILARFERQTAAAVANALRLRGPRSEGSSRVGDEHSALQRARDALAAAAMREPPASAREMRQLMADVKLLEPDAYGTRAAMGGVVLGAQQMRAATIAQVRSEGFRTRREIARGIGEPGPRRLDTESGRLIERSAEEEVQRRRHEAAPHVGRDAGGTREATAYERNARALSLARAVLGHLLQHATATSRGVSGAAKNLGRIALAAHDSDIPGARGGGLSHLPDIVAAKGAQDPPLATRDALSAWAAESDVAGWADREGHPLDSNSEQLVAFIAWSQSEGARLVDALETRTDTAHMGDAPDGLAVRGDEDARRQIDQDQPADGDAENHAEPARERDQPDLDTDHTDPADIIDEMMGIPSDRESFDRRAMEEFYGNHMDQNPHLEVSLVRNTETGQMVVVQGNASRITYRRLISDVHELIDPSLHGRGRWVVESHSHGVDVETGMTPLADRVPSLVDIAGLVTEAHIRGGRAQEEIVIVTGRGRESIIAAFEPGAGAGAGAGEIVIDLPRPDGTREVRRFADIESVAEWSRLRFGADPGPIPAGYSGPRRSRPHEGPGSGDHVDEPGVVSQTTTDDQFARQEYFSSDNNSDDPDAPHNARYHADSRLSSNGTLTMDFSLREERDGQMRRSSLIRGRQHFNESLAYFRGVRGEDAVQRIEGDWGAGDNLDAFTARHQQLVDLGMSDGDARLVAASETATGQWATEAGFGQISDVTIGEHGVRAVFESGASNVPDVPAPGDASAPPAPRRGNSGDEDGRDTVPASPPTGAAQASSPQGSSEAPAPRHHEEVRRALRATFDRGMPPPEQFVQARTLDEYIATWRSLEPAQRANDDPPGPAFYDRTTKKIHMDNGVQPATVAHEALHALTHDAFFSAVPTWLNEGVTEILTAEAIGRPAADTNYVDNVGVAIALRDVVGTNVLRAAYFDGNIAQLAAALDQATGRDGTLTLLRNVLPTSGIARIDADMLRAAHAILTPANNPVE